MVPSKFPLMAVDGDKTDINSIYQTESSKVLRWKYIVIGNDISRKLIENSRTVCHLVHALHVPL